MAGIVPTIENPFPDWSAPFFASGWNDPLSTTGELNVFRGAEFNYDLPGTSFGGGDLLPLVQTGIQLGAGAIQQSQAASAQTAAQQKQIGQAWTQLVQQALALYQSISAKPVITAADVAQAQAAYNALESFVAQYGNDYIVAQWNSDAYKGAALHDLQLYQQRLASQSTGTAAGTPAASVFADSAGGISVWWIVGGIVALFLLKGKG